MHLIGISKGSPNTDSTRRVLKPQDSITRNYIFQAHSRHQGAGAVARGRSAAGGSQREAQPREWRPAGRGAGGGGALGVRDWGMAEREKLSEKE